MRDLNARKLEQAAALLRAGNAMGAKGLVEPIARAAPGLLPAQRLLAAALLQLGDIRSAAGVYARCAALHPADLEIASLHGETLAAAGRVDEAIPILARVHAAAPGNVRVSIALAGAWTLMGRPSKAAEIAREVLESSPDHVDALGCLAQTCVALGRADEGLALFDRALQHRPGDYKFCEAAAIAAMYAGEIEPETVVAAHRRYADSLRPYLRGVPVPLHVPGLLPPKEGPIRVGILSPDFKKHATSFYLLPLFERLDRERFPLFMYSIAGVQDEVTARYRSLATEFRDVSALTGLDTARAIAADRVHVLIETAGLTTSNRLACLALRPAPVQLSYLGYPGTTGLSEVSARLVDVQTDPQGSEPLSVERLIRLDPCCMVFRPHASAPNVSPGPSARGEPFAFGSFSTVPKLNAPLIRGWSKAILAVPGSRLLLKHSTLADEGLRADLLSRFVACGLSADRVMIEPPDTGPGTLLDHYARIDVALDTFPYSGTTTVCEALYMGVPVVIRPGRSSVSRQSLTIIHALGLDELIARDESHFVQVAAELAADPPRLAALRASLRGRFLASPLNDAAALARRFEAALVDVCGRIG